MRCLVTGVAGFVGSHLAERLLAEGHVVCGIDAFIDYYPRPIKERNLQELRLWKDFTFIEGDLREIHLLPLLRQEYEPVGDRNFHGMWTVMYCRRSNY